MAERINNYEKMMSEEIEEKETEVLNRSDQVLLAIARIRAVYHWLF